MRGCCNLQGRIRCLSITCSVTKPKGLELLGGIIICVAQGVNLDHHSFL